MLRSETLWFYGSTVHIGLTVEREIVDGWFISRGWIEVGMKESIQKTWEERGW